MSGLGIQNDYWLRIRLHLAEAAHPPFESLFCPVIIGLYLESAFAQMGVHFAPGGRAGSLADMIFGFCSSEPSNVAKCVRDILQKAGLQQSYSLVVFDPDANLYRPIGEQNGGPIDRRIVTSIMNQSVTQFAEAHRARMELLQERLQSGNGLENPS